MDTLRKWLQDTTNKVIVGLIVVACTAFFSSYFANILSAQDMRRDISDLAQSQRKTEERHKAEDANAVPDAIFRMEVSKSINALSVNQAKVLKKLGIQPEPYTMIQQK